MEDAGEVAVVVYEGAAACPAKMAEAVQWVGVVQMEAQCAKVVSVAWRGAEVALAAVGATGEGFAVANVAVMETTEIVMTAPVVVEVADENFAAFEEMEEYMRWVACICYGHKQTWSTKVVAAEVIALAGVLVVAAEVIAVTRALVVAAEVIASAGVFVMAAEVIVLAGGLVIAAEVIAMAMSMTVIGTASGRDPARCIHCVHM